MHSLKCWDRLYRVLSPGFEVLIVPNAVSPSPLFKSALVHTLRSLDTRPGAQSAETCVASFLQISLIRGRSRERADIQNRLVRFHLLPVGLGYAKGLRPRQVALRSFLAMLCTLGR